MNGKINQFLVVIGGLWLAWYWLGAQRRRALHQYSQIAAGVLLASAVLALLLHFY